MARPRCSYYVYRLSCMMVRSSLVRPCLGSISFRTRVNGLEVLACLTPPPHGEGRKTFYSGNQVK
jgi:hypothetical protein